ncbi:MAG: alpha/beta hydrolase [Candidatus Lokiarchaeota archaeon]|nr:alpha/beta hydrolase [Candidatus Lokiarchaeota archaeon]
MPIVDKSKFHRPEIIRIMKTRKHNQKLFMDAFFEKTGSDRKLYLPIFKKIDDLNISWIHGKNTKGILSAEDILLAVKYLRFFLEFQAEDMQKLTPIPRKAIVEPVSEGGVSAEWNAYPGSLEDYAMIYIHGGGHIMGSVKTHRLFTLELAKVTNLRVLSINYRLAPEHPHPAALEDCVSAYNWLLSLGFKSSKIIISGDSAGGYYTLLTLLKLRDDGSLLPAGAICFSPSTDMAQTGESVKKNCYTDLILGDLGYIWWINAHIVDADPYDASISPLYADLKGLPPILIQVSTSEMLFDDSRMFYERAREAGVDVTLQTWDDTLHVFQNKPQLPETKEAMEEVRDFVKKLI